MHVEHLKNLILDINRVNMPVLYAQLIPLRHKKFMMKYYNRRGRRTGSTHIYLVESLFFIGNHDSEYNEESAWVPSDANADSGSGLNGL